MSETPKGIDGLCIDPRAYIDRNTLLVGQSINSDQRLVFDDTTNTARIVTVTDVNPTLELNKTYQNSGLDGYTKSRAMRWVAEIDPAIIEQWNATHKCNVLAPENKELFKRLLNDPDNRFVRTGLGRL